MKTQQEWMDLFNEREQSTNRIPAKCASVSARDIWEIQCDASATNADAIINELGGERGFDQWWQGLTINERDSIRTSLNALLYPGDCPRTATEAMNQEAAAIATALEALQAENQRIRKIAAHVPPKLWLEAEYAAGHARQIKANEPGRTDDWTARQRKEGLH